jgi:regulator of replication initiation timing
MSDLELTMMRRVGELKAEVERLDTLCKQVMAQHSDISCENIMLRKANDQLAEVRELHAGFNRALFNETVTENARLKAEVERLTKAGDAMLSEWASGDEKDAQNFLKALVIWNAAKEGKGQP